MLVETRTGQYDDAKEYTAWELGADWWWESRGYRAKLVGGHITYDLIRITRNESVVAERINFPVSFGKLKVTIRYLNPDAKMVLTK